MAEYMLQLSQFRELVFHDVALSPDLDLFQSEFRKHRLSNLVLGHPRVGKLEWAECCNHFVLTVREAGKRIRIKAKIKDWRNGAKKNAKRLKKYLKALFDRYARIMVVRLDFYYHEGACRDDAQADEWQMTMQALDQEAHYTYEGVASSPADVLVELNEKIPRVDIQTVAGDWARFMDNTRGKTSLFKHKVGHVAAIECARIGGHHIHVAFFFDGSQVHQDQYMADEIGKYWVQVTKGRGYYHNCNRHTYRKRAVGMVEHDNEEVRRNLLEAMTYLAKQDQLVRIKPAVKTKTFFTGQMPGPKTGRTGRPRRRGAKGGVSQRDEDVSD